MRPRRGRGRPEPREGGPALPLARRSCAFACGARAGGSGSGLPASPRTAAPPPRRRGGMLLRVCGRYTLTAASAAGRRALRRLGAATGSRRASTSRPARTCPSRCCVAAGGREPRRAALGPRAAAGRESAGLRRAADQRTGRERGRAAGVPRCLPDAALPRCPPTASTSGARRAGGAEPHHVALPGRRTLRASPGFTQRFAARGRRALRSVAILTGPARGRLRELHDRMPVILLAPTTTTPGSIPRSASPRDVHALLGSRALGRRSSSGRSTRA